jgi:hypothetical protein
LQALVLGDSSLRREIEITLKNRHRHQLNITPESEMAAAFIEAIKTKDVAAFWNLLSKESQGYLYGCLVATKVVNFYGFDPAAPEVIARLTTLLEDIIKYFKSALAHVIDNPGASKKIGRSEDGLCAQVKIFCNRGNSPVTFIKPAGDRGVIVPLIMELNRIDLSGATTTWAVDYLKIFSLNKAAE